ncbi:MAG: hypothetical protein JWO13_108 [Acidobacteriales bacterium]|nr:hypothetical protein [Terriglobales bacterium]
MISVRTIRKFLALTSLMVFVSVAGVALPIKPKLSDIIKEAQKPQVHYPPARAGWNGPEEKSAVGHPNAVYDQMRYAMSAEAARAHLVQAATPDWRVLVLLATVVLFWRYKLERGLRSGVRHKNNVITMPSPSVTAERAA